MQKGKMSALFQHSSKYICVLWSVLAVALLANCAYADIPANEVKITTPVYHADTAAFKPPLGIYEYSVKWNGLGAARIWLNVDKIGMYYQVSTVVKTNSVVDILYKLRYVASGVLSSVDLLPVRSVMESKENSKEKKSEVIFLPNGDIKSTYWRKGRGTQEQNFDPGNFMLDPFSVAFMARSLSWKKGDSRQFDTYNGKSRYLITFTALGETKIEVNGKDRDVWVISPKVQKLTKKNPKKKLREAKIYITTDEKREILKIVSEVFIGSVTIKLVSFTPSPKTSASTTRVAKAEAPKTQRIRLR